MCAGGEGVTDLNFAHVYCVASAYIPFLFRRHQGHPPRACGLRFLRGIISFYSVPTMSGLALEADLAASEE